MGRYHILADMQIFAFADTLINTADIPVFWKNAGTVKVQHTDADTVNTEKSADMLMFTIPIWEPPIGSNDRPDFSW